MSKNINKYKEVLSFSAWVGYGAVASIGKNQGSALVVNLFFNTAMNTALGIANNVSALITLFAQNVAQPIAPQITKSYSAGDYERCDNLLILSTKGTFMMMFLVAVPFIVDTEFLLSLWLGKVPEYATEFTLLLVIDTLIGAFNSGLSTIMFASGKIKLYQLSLNSLKILAVVAGYFILKNGGAPEYLFFTFMFFSVIIFFVGQVVLHVSLKYSNIPLIKKSYLPCALIAVLSLSFIKLLPAWHPFIRIFCSVLVVILFEFFIGLNSKERSFILSKLKVK